MDVAGLFDLPACSGLKAVNHAELRRAVQVAHLVDMTEVQRWVIPGTLLLTTGLAWPQDAGQRRLLAQMLARCEPAAVVLAVPKHFQGFPAEMAQILEAAGIPAFELPWDRPFVRVALEVHNEILREHGQELRRSERLHRALTRAALSGNLADVTGTLAENLGLEAVILSAEGKALTPAPPVYPSAVQAVNALSRAGTAARGLAGGTLVPIVLRGGRGGGVWLPGKVDQVALRAAEHAATVAGLLLLAQRDAELTEARLGYAFVDTLLGGQFSDDLAAYERATRAGFDPDGIYTVAMLSLMQKLPLSAEGFTLREQATRHLREVLLSLGSAPLISVNLNQIWFLLPETVRPERVWSRLSWSSQPPSETAGQPSSSQPAPNQVAPGGGMVYSRPRKGAANVVQSRNEVLSLAAHARAGQLLSYAEVLLPRVLSGDAAAQADLVSSFLAPVRASRSGAVLLETIQMLCDTGFSQIEAASRLGIHANTLRYRIERLETLTERALDDPQTRSLWWLVLQLAASIPAKDLVKTSISSG